MGVSCSYLLPSQQDLPVAAWQFPEGWGLAISAGTTRLPPPPPAQPAIAPSTQTQGTGQGWYPPPRCLWVRESGLCGTGNISQGCPGILLSLGRGWEAWPLAAAHPSITAWIHKWGLSSDPPSPLCTFLVLHQIPLYT